MICRSVLGKVGDDAAGVDWVEIDWPLTLRRALRLISSAGKPVDILLPPGGRLAHGDVLFDSPEVRIAVFLRPCDVLALRPPERDVALRLALRLGNLHLSAEVRNEVIYTPADGPAMEIAAGLKVPFSIEKRRFYPDETL